MSRLQSTYDLSAKIRRYSNPLGLALLGAFAVAAGSAFFEFRAGIDVGRAFSLLELGFSGVGLAILALAASRIGREAERIERGTRAMLDHAHRDALTGALGRSAFLDVFKRKLRKRTDVPLTYIHIDMDHLKQLNDGGGHAAGDAALAQLVKLVRTRLPQAMIGRLGGDEFGVVLTDCRSHAEALRICGQLLELLEAPVTILDRKVRLSATMGVAMAPQDANSVEDLISKADLALYQGKSSGRNMAVAFSNDMLVDERHRRYIERELRGALLMNELELYYQPIYANDGVTLVAYEALVRWNHPVRGVVPPGEFIEVAERGYLIDKLGDWVLRRACRDLHMLEAPSLTINVSVVQLQRIDFAERFREILSETGVAGDRLIVEVTESVRLASAGPETANLDALRAMGVRIAIDDFGAGNASLAYLKDYAFDVLKVDRAYAGSLSSSRVDWMIVESVCKIARASNMSVVVEGVETQAQLDALQELGSCALQGYLLGRPQPLATIVSDRRMQSAKGAA